MKFQKSCLLVAFCITFSMACKTTSITSKRIDIEKTYPSLDTLSKEELLRRYDKVREYLYGKDIIRHDEATGKNIYTLDKNSNKYKSAHLIRAFVLKKYPKDAYLYTNAIHTLEAFLWQRENSLSKLKERSENDFTSNDYYTMEYLENDIKALKMRINKLEKEAPNSPMQR